MQSEEFNELSGRIDGLARAVMLLIVESEESKVISSGFSERLKIIADSLQYDNQPLMDAAKRTLCEISSGIGDAHKHRRLMAG